MKRMESTEHNECILHAQLWATMQKSVLGEIAAGTNSFEVFEELPAKEEVLCTKARGGCVRND